MIQLMALYFFIGLALAAGIAAYSRIDQLAVYELEKTKIAYQQGGFKGVAHRFTPNFRRVQATAV